MTDKVQKIRKGVERLKSQLLRGACSSQIAMETMCKEEAYNEVLAILDTMQEEPVSEELEECTREIILEGANFNKSWYAHPELAFKAGAKCQKENLWKPADGDELPEYEREVVVFTQNFPDDAGIMMVAIGHRPTPEGFDGKSLTTGEVEHYTPKTYDKGGWNIPDVKYWLDCYLPKEIEEL